VTFTVGLIFRGDNNDIVNLDISWNPEPFGAVFFPEVIGLIDASSYPALLIVVDGVPHLNPKHNAGVRDLNDLVMLHRRT